MTNRLDQLQSLLKESPKDSFLLFAIAKEYEKQGQFDKALEYYLDLQSADPSYVGTYYHLGKLYEHFEKTEEALQTYDSGMKMAKEQGDQHSHNELAGARLNLEME